MAESQEADACSAAGDFNYNSQCLAYWENQGTNGCGTCSSACTKKKLDAHQPAIENLTEEVESNKKDTAKKFFNATLAQQLLALIERHQSTMSSIGD